MVIYVNLSFTYFDVRRKIFLKGILSSREEQKKAAGYPAVFCTFY